MKRNDFLFVFAVIVIVLALLNISITISKIKTFTGRATGTLNLTVDSGVSINFTTRTIDWSSGVVTGGQINATLDTASGTVANGNWTVNSAGLVLENIGNTNATIDIKTGKTAAQFIGGTSPQYLLNFTNSEANSCYNFSGVSLGLWYAVNTTDPGTRICGNLTFYNSTNSMRIDLKLGVPYDSLTGALSDIITATATSA